ncbi:hypothetical protein PRUPE_2G237700 [Prunus persica]|uniref:Secreted protein n=1 Tax=Prunus persica TaxID=3760 RepID=A0A251QKP5_PRUPE|nr:hypothetical protein PRUPE_2G237700 [Prunus persica]ONI24387.1 hypothetical protein PRUPE_2G237700 [Prunus persica]
MRSKSLIQSSLAAVSSFGLSASLCSLYHFCHAGQDEPSSTYAILSHLEFFQHSSYFICNLCALSCIRKYF